MESIKIDDGTKRIAINDDPDKVITFNPRDTLFMEKFYKICGEISSKLEEIQNTDAAPDIEKQFAIVQEVNAFVREKIDYAFGAGTSQKAFGDTVSYDFDMYSQFIDGIKPFIEPVRVAKVTAYLPTTQKPARRKRK